MGSGAPEGNRRGTFAATPEGKPDAPGTPELHASKNGKDAGAGTQGNASSGTGHGASGVRSLPSAISVGAPPPGAPVAAVAGAAANSAAKMPDFKAMIPSVRQTMAAASAPLPRANAGSANETPDSKVTPLDRRIFGVKRTYTLGVNSPNLNSVGGSWVIHFAELKGEASPGRVAAPEVIEKVDPKYPEELQRRHYEGTVTLYAVIHTDGRVSDVRVVEGIGGELDEFARAALERWRFRPALKDGEPVALEALVSIPFKARTKF